MATEQSLDALPDQLANLVKAVAAASVTVVDTSKAREPWPVGAREIYSMARAAMKWRLFFSSRKTNVVFFFFRSEKEFTSVDARVSAFLDPTTDSSLTFRQIAGGPVQVLFPVFIVTSLSQGEFALFAPPGATEKNTLILALNPTQTALFAISFGKVPAVRFSENRVPGKVEQGKYSLGPLLNVVELMRNFSPSDWPLGPPVKRQNLANPTVGTIVAKLEQGYEKAKSSLSELGPAMVGTMDLSCRSLSGYSADLTISLKNDGSLATAADDERYRVDVTFRIPDGRDTIPQLLPQLPLMQPGKNLYDSIFDNLLGDGLLTMADLLSLQGSSTDARKLLARQFLESARKDATILLMERHPGSRKYLVVLHGELFGRGATTLVCSLELAQFSEDSVSWSDEGDHESIALFQGDAGGVVIGKDEANLLFPAFAAIKQWKDLL